MNKTYIIIQIKLPTISIAKMLQIRFVMMKNQINMMTRKIWKTLSRFRMRKYSKSKMNKSVKNHGLHEMKRKPRTSCWNKWWEIFKIIKEGKRSWGKGMYPIISIWPLGGTWWSINKFKFQKTLRNLKGHQQIVIRNILYSMVNTNLLDHLVKD